MRLFIAFTVVSCLLCGPAAAQEDSALVPDNNTAFYEGDKLSYIISPPDGFVMVDSPAIEDGFSFAFIPEDETYDSVSVLIGANLFRIKAEVAGKITLDDIIRDDTTAIRAHFGETLDMYETDSVVTKAGYTIRNFFFNDTTRFIPNVMMSYLDGGSEILIFELSISPDFPRFMAEQLYMQCLERLKVLVKGKLETG